METKTVILEDGDLYNMTYDGLQSNRLSYEQNHINRHNKEEKKKPIAFSVINSEEDENIEEDHNEGMALINHGRRQILRQRQQRPQQTFKDNEFTRNDDCGYHCGKPGHIKQNYPELRKRSSKEKRNFGAWNDEDESKDDAETTNMCFMTIR